MRPRRVTKRERRQVIKAMADWGDHLQATRDQDGHIAEGYPTFEGYLRARVPEISPAHWKLTPDQAVELAGTALQLADERRRKAAGR